MIDILGWCITALVIVLVLTFLGAVVSLHRLPTNERPKTATYDRFGEFIGMKENPDYHENPGEKREDDERAREAS